MSVLKTSSDIDRFVLKPDPKIVAVMAYGPNSGLVSNIIHRLAKSVAGSLDDPFNVVVLDETQLKDTPGILRDEALALSFTGGRKVVWIRETGPWLGQQLENLLSDDTSANLVIIEADNLPKTNAARKLMEKSKSAICIPCYEDSPQQLIQLVMAESKNSGFQIEPKAAGLFIEFIGLNREIILSELDKLQSYCFDSKVISVDDVSEICNDPMLTTLEGMIDSALIGDVSKATRKFRQLNESGILAAQILNRISMQIANLLKFRNDTENGKSVDMAMRSGRPPIFFKRQATVRKQITIWSSQKLKTAQDLVFSATLLTRNEPSISDEICERAIISLGKMARANMR